MTNRDVNANIVKHSVIIATNDGGRVGNSEEHVTRAIRFSNQQ